MSVIAVSMAFARPADAEESRRIIWPSWNYVVSHGDARVDISVQWPQKPKVGESARPDGPIWYGRLLLQLGDAGRLPDLTLSVSFLDREASGGFEYPTIEQLAEELNEASNRVGVARGRAAGGRFLPSDFSAEVISGRRWYVWRGGACNLRYLTIIDQKTAMQVTVYCGGGHWSGLTSRERRWQPWIHSALNSIRVSGMASE